MPLPFDSFSTESIYVLGDSHSETFAMRCYQVGERRLIFRPIYIPYAQSRFFEAKPGRLSRHLLSALTHAGLAVVVSPREIGILHTTADPHWQHIAIVRGIPHADPLITFSIGSIDLLHFSSNVLRAFDEIAVDGETSTASSIGFGAATDLFYLKMKPFEDALITLRSLGFLRLALLSLVPFSSGDNLYAASAERINLPQRDAHLVPLWRSKLLRIGNETLAKIAHEVGIPFIDRGIDWDGTGLAAPGLLIDGIHLDADARDRSAISIINAIYQLADSIDPPMRPKMYQVKIDDEMEKSGWRELTIAEESFVEIRDEGAGAFCRLRDVNTGEVVWMNRNRIISIVPIL